MIDDVLAARDRAADRLKNSKQKLERERELLKGQFDRDEITEGFYRQELRRLETEKDQRDLAAFESLHALKEEYHAALAEWSKLDSNALDMNTIWILDNMDLSAEQFDDLARQFRYNATMTAVIDRKSDEKASRINSSNAGLPLNNQRHFERKYRPLGAPERERAFDSLVKACEHSLTKYCDISAYKDMKSYLNDRAAETVRNLEPLDDDDKLNGPETYPVEYAEAPERPLVW